MSFLLKFSTRDLIFLLLNLSIIVDLITGSSIINDPTSETLAGILYKSMLLVLLYKEIMRINKYIFSITIIIIALTIFTSIADLPSLIKNLTASSKLLLFFQLFYYLRYLNHNNLISTYKLFLIIKLAFIIILANQILGIFGLGKSTYTFENRNLGTSGFFFETNSYSYILLIVSTFLFLFYKKEFRSKAIIIISFLSVLIGVSISTKVAIGGSVMFSLLLLYEYKKKVLFALIILLGLVFTWKKDYILDSRHALYYISSFENNTNNALFSGRDINKEKSMKIFKEKYSTVEKLIGIGQHRILNDKIFGGTSEMDHIDILRTNGIIGLLIIYLSYLYISFLHLKMYYIHKIKEFNTIFIINMILLVFSSLAGHLFTSGSVSIYLAVLNIYPYALYKEQAFIKST